MQDVPIGVLILKWTAALQEWI